MSGAALDTAIDPLKKRCALAGYPITGTAMTLEGVDCNVETSIELVKNAVRRASMCAVWLGLPTRLLPPCLCLVFKAVRSSAPQLMEPIMRLDVPAREENVGKVECRDRWAVVLLFSTVSVV